MGVFVRRVRTASGATAVQIVHKRGRTVLGIEHIGSAHTDDELALLRIRRLKCLLLTTAGSWP